MKHVVAFVFLLMPFFLLSCNTADKNREAENASQAAETSVALYTNISPDEAYGMLQEASPLLLDVRTTGEYEDLHVPGSLLIPLDELSSRLAELDAYKESDILVMCRSGNRSRTASEILVRNGFKAVYNIQQGITGWERSGYPVE